MAGKHFLLIALLTLAGCAKVSSKPKYVTNWDQLQEGMTKNEVIILLGKPLSCLKVELADREPNQPLLKHLAGIILSKALFDLWFERWHYGEFGLFEDFTGPPYEAFVVYFNSAGKVIKFRRPQTGPYSSISQEVRDNKQQTIKKRPSM